jgi:hypothetical protein
MKKFFIALSLVVHLLYVAAQADSPLHHGTFKKTKIFMSSRPYKPDNWEKPYYDSAIKSAFPSALVKFPERYTGKLIHLIGIVDSITIESKDSSTTVTFLLNNKYWDYIEDYSIQDEVMFVSDKGDGKFWATLTGLNAGELEAVRAMTDQHKLFLVYGYYKTLSGSYPLIAASQIKYIDYELYTTKVFSYDIQKNDRGEIELDKNGKVKTIDFKFLKIAKAGQNK